MRVDKGDDAVAFDNMQNRAVKGNSEWKSYQVVLNVQEDATRIAIGILLHATGTVWINGVTVDVVDRNVPVTDMLPQASKPGNLGFEK